MFPKQSLHPGGNNVLEIDLKQFSCLQRSEFASVLQHMFHARLNLAAFCFYSSQQCFCNNVSWFSQALSSGSWGYFGEPWIAAFFWHETFNEWIYFLSRDFSYTVLFFRGGGVVIGWSARRNFDREFGRSLVGWLSCPERRNVIVHVVFLNSGVYM